MARIAGINIPDTKRVEIALTYVYGIGRESANKILTTAGVDRNIRVSQLSGDQMNALRTIIERDHTVEGELRRQVLGNIKRLKEIAAYRGIRHMKHLPVHGQRTKTNSRTVRGNVRRTMGSGKRKVDLK